MERNWGLISFFLLNWGNEVGFPVEEVLVRFYFCCSSLWDFLEKEGKAVERILNIDNRRAEWNSLQKYGEFFFQISSFQKIYSLRNFEIFYENVFF